MHSRRIAILAAVLAATTILQSCLGSRLSLGAARPDLVLLLVVTVSIVRGVEEGLLGGIIGGVMVDMLSVAPFGTATLGMAAIGVLTGLGESNIYRANLIVPLVVVFLATVFYHAYLMLAFQAIGWNVEWISTLALQTIPGASLNAVLAPVALPLVRRLLSARHGEERFQW